MLYELFILIKNKKQIMINQITKYFSDQSLSIYSGNYLSRNKHIRLQAQTINSVNKVLTTFFKKFYVLISTPSYSIQENSIKITIFYYQAPSLGKKTRTNRKTTDIRSKYWNKFFSNFKGLISNNNNLILNKNSKNARLKFLAVLLSKMLQSNVQLEVVRLKYVYHDSNILAQFLGINSHKSTYGQFKNILRRKVTIQESDSNSTVNNGANTINPITFLTGFKIKISGRLNRQRVVPKKTVKSTYKGAISANINNVVDQSTFTGKNKKGAYSIRVWLSHGTSPIIKQRN